MNKLLSISSAVFLAVAGSAIPAYAQTTQEFASAAGILGNPAALAQLQACEALPADSRAAAFSALLSSNVAGNISGVAAALAAEIVANPAAYGLDGAAAECVVTALLAISGTGPETAAIPGAPAPIGDDFPTNDEDEGDEASPA